MNGKGPMLSLAHEIAVARLAENPSLLSRLAEKLLARPFRGPPRPRSSTVQLADPELAFFAAWAVAGRRGPDALDLVERALHVTRSLPTDLRRKQGKDILQVLNGRLVGSLKERWRMDATKSRASRETRALREWR